MPSLSAGGKISAHLSLATFLYPFDKMNNKQTVLPQRVEFSSEESPQSSVKSHSLLSGMQASRSQRHSSLLQSSVVGAIEM